MSWERSKEVDELIKKLNEENAKRYASEEQLKNESKDN